MFDITGYVSPPMWCVSDVRPSLALVAVGPDLQLTNAPFKHALELGTDSLNRGRRNIVVNQAVSSVVMHVTRNGLNYIMNYTNE